MAARRVIPRDGRFLPVSLVVVLALALAPPVPLPSGRLPDFSAAAGQEPTETRADAPLMEDKAKPLAKERLKPSAFEERDFATRAGVSGGSMSGDLSAIFKDTALSSQRPEFQSYLKKGDERLKLLEQADRLPDLQSDFTASQYKMVYRKSKSLTSGGLRDISPQKLKELLEEMERLGRKEGYDTNLTGRGGQMGSRLQYLGVIGQYRKAMEDALARESVPRDFHDQIKDYFQALDER